MPAGAPGWSRARKPSARDRTRQAILETALRLFTDRGYVGVRVEDIARESGVSRATFYKHFAERDEILGELFGKLLDDSAVGEVAEGATNGDVESRVFALLAGAVSRMVDQEVLAKFVYSLPVRHDAVLPGGAAVPAVFTRVAAELAAARERHELRDEVPDELALAVLGRVFEASMRDWAEGRAEDPVARLRQLVGIVFRGVAAPVSRPAARAPRARR